MPFNQNLNGHTFKDFQNIAAMKEKEDEHLDWQDDRDIFNNIESKYWDYVEHQIGEEYKVEYAADLNARQYGSGFGMKGQ